MRKSSNASVAQAIRADARARKEMALSDAQRRYLLTANDNGAVKDWAAPSNATLKNLLNRGFLEDRGGGHHTVGSTNFFYLTEKGRFALAKATGSET